MSDGTSILPGSVTQLFQHGIFHPFGGERRTQRLERLIDRRRELGEWCLDGWKRRCGWNN